MFRSYRIVVNIDEKLHVGKILEQLEQEMLHPLTPACTHAELQKVPML